MSSCSHVDYWPHSLSHTIRLLHSINSTQTAYLLIRFTTHLHHIMQHQRKCCTGCNFSLLILILFPNKELYITHVLKYSFGKHGIFIVLLKYDMLVPSYTFHIFAVDEILIMVYRNTWCIMKTFVWTASCIWNGSSEMTLLYSYCIFYCWPIR